MGYNEDDRRRDEARNSALRDARRQAERRETLISICDDHRSRIEAYQTQLDAQTDRLYAEQDLAEESRRMRDGGYRFHDTTTDRAVSRRPTRMFEEVNIATDPESMRRERLIQHRRRVIEAIRNGDHMMDRVRRQDWCARLAAIDPFPAGAATALERLRDDISAYQRKIWEQPSTVGGVKDCRDRRLAAAVDAVHGLLLEVLSEDG